MKNSVEAANHTELMSKSTGEKYSMSAVLSEIAGFKDVRVHHEILPPDRKSSAPHAHSHREEMVYVLAGSPTAYLRGELYELTPGEFISFPPGERNIHYIQNRSRDEVRLLVIASNPANDEVIYGES